MEVNDKDKNKELNTPAEKGGYIAGTMIGYISGAGICAILITVILKIMKWIWLL